MLLARNTMLPGVGTYRRCFWHKTRHYLVWEHTRRTPNDLLELVSVRRKEMYKAHTTISYIQPISCDKEIGVANAPCEHAFERKIIK